MNPIESNPAPAFASSYSPNVRWTNSKLVRQFFVSSSVRPYCNHVFFHKFFAVNVVPVLSHHIVGVFSDCSKKQVTRIAAWRVVAFVKHSLSFWDWSFFQLPHDSSGDFVFSVPPHDSISLGGSCPRPRPTFIWRLLNNFIPKSFLLAWKIQKRQELHSLVMLFTPSFASADPASSGKDVSVAHVKQLSTET